MRHRNKVKKLGRTASHRKAMLKNMATSLFVGHDLVIDDDKNTRHFKQIKTTLSKAKAVQRYAEKLITYGKNDTVHSRRQAFKHLQSRDVVKVLFDDVASQYGDRNGGYTRVIKLGQRRGDGAEMAILQLVGWEHDIVDDGPTRKKSRKTTKKSSTKKAAAPAAAAAAAPVVAEAEEVVEEVVDDVNEANEAAAAAAEAAEDATDAAEDATDAAEDEATGDDGDSDDGKKE